MVMSSTSKPGTSEGLGSPSVTSTPGGNEYVSRTFSTIAALSSARTGAASAPAKSRAAITAWVFVFMGTSQFEFTQPVRHEADDHRQPVREDQQADEHEQGAGEHLSGADEALVAGEELQESVDAEAREDERDAEAEGVDEQEQRPLIEGLLPGRQAEDPGEDR